MSTQPGALDLRLVNDSSAEAQTRDLLVELLDTYPLEKWRYADVVQIEDDVIPHSHPILTLNSRHDPQNALRLLSSYIHEQLHWFWLLEQHGPRTWEALRQLREAFPTLPLDPPAGCGSEISNYLHVAINYLECLALGELIGPEPARAFVARKPYYTAIYALVLAETNRIQSILDPLHLVPQPSPPTAKRFFVPDEASSR